MTTNNTLIADGTTTTEAVADVAGSAPDAVITAANDQAKTQAPAEGAVAPKDGEAQPDITVETPPAEPKVDEPKAPDPDAKKDEPKKDELKKEGPPEKYEIKFEEGRQVDAVVLGDFESVAKELGLSQAQAQKLADFGPKISDLVIAKNNAALKDAQTKWHEQSVGDKEFGGTKYNENLSIAKRALDNFASPELVQLLKDTGLQMHPEVIRLFYKAGKTISEDKIVNGGNSSKAETRSPADILYGKPK